MIKQKNRKSSHGAYRAVLARINEAGWIDLKILAAEQGSTLNALAVEAFNDLLKKYGKKASIQNPLID